MSLRALLHLLLHAAVALFCVNPHESLRGSVALNACLDGAKKIQLWHSVSVKQLSLMLIPIALRTTEQFLREVPNSLREGALALGASKPRAVATVILPAATTGILTGVILGVARIAGETAPLLFTALNNQYWAKTWREPIASLPVMIYTHAISPYDDWHRQAWAAGLVLLALVLVANIAARLILARGASAQRG